MGQLVKYILDSNRKVSSRELNSIFHIDKTNNNGWPVTRSTLKLEIKKTGACIGSDTSGYFEIKTFKQLEDYKSNLESRIRGIKGRLKMAVMNFKRGGRN